MYVGLGMIHYFPTTYYLDVIVSTVLTGILYFWKPGPIVTWSALAPRFALVNILYYTYHMPRCVGRFYIFHPSIIASLLDVILVVCSVVFGDHLNEFDPLEDEVKMYTKDMAVGKGRVWDLVIMFTLPRLLSVCLISTIHVWMGLVAGVSDILLCLCTFSLVGNLTLTPDAGAMTMWQALRNCSLLHYAKSVYKKIQSACKRYQLWTQYMSVCYMCAFLSLVQDLYILMYVTLICNCIYSCVVGLFPSGCLKHVTTKSVVAIVSLDRVMCLQYLPSIHL